ncbi:MAG: Gfo/Idh/MocA family oxidoreductase [Faecalibacterium sp.]
MAQKSDGMNYAPKGKAEPVVSAGEFVVGVIALDHGHINGMCNGLSEAGATLKWVYDKDPAKVADFIKKYPGMVAASSEEKILNDPEVKLIAAAAVPNLRAALGIRVMKAGKDYFTDKTPMTTLAQLAAVKAVCAETGRRYWCYFSERLHVEAAVYAGDLVKQGAIGKVVQVMGLGPHRLSKDTRPDWFFNKEEYGGILCDIGSHQIEQFLYYADVKDATVLSSKVGNYHNADTPEFEDFGDATLVGDNGATNYFRVDWFTPDGLSTWGDGRMFILGTEGYIELRKYANIAEGEGSDFVYFVNAEGEHKFHVQGQVGYPFFGQMILDSIHRTETAMTQAHIFKAAELCIKTQLMSIHVTQNVESIGQ